MTVGILVKSTTFHGNDKEIGNWTGNRLYDLTREIVLEAIFYDFQGYPSTLPRIGRVYPRLLLLFLLITFNKDPSSR